MYLPPAFAVSDEGRALAFIDEYPFATLIVTAGETPFVNHLPLLLVPAPDGNHCLIGHMARKNPQWQVFATNPSVTVVFHGPHTYVTPTWYRQDDVPTWNYAVAHVSGHVRLIEDFRGLTKMLSQLTTRFERSEKTPWRFYLPDDLQSEAQLTGAIVGFAIDGLKIQTKFKLSQNRSVEDQEGVRAGLAQRADEMSLKIRELMLPTS